MMILRQIRLKQHQWYQRAVRAAITMILLSLSLFSSASGYFGAPQEAFLELDEAFKSSVSINGKHIMVSWVVAPGYYLYQKQFQFQVLDQAGEEIPLIGRPTYSPAGIERHDEFMGQVMTFSDVVDVSIPVAAGPARLPTSVQVNFQGCAEAGLCYPPSKRTHQLK